MTNSTQDSPVNGEENNYQKAVNAFVPRDYALQTGLDTALTGDNLQATLTFLIPAPGESWALDVVAMYANGDRSKPYFLVYSAGLAERCGAEFIMLFPILHAHDGEDLGEVAVRQILHNSAIQAERGGLSDANKAAIRTVINWIATPPEDAPEGNYIDGFTLTENGQLLASAMRPAFKGNK